MDVTLYAVVMTFGGLVAGVGLALLFLRKEQSENRIKVFGWEFQISTPALVVFLAGCGVFIIPLVLPVENRTVLSIWHRDGPQPDQTDELPGGKSITAATLIKTGTIIKGSIISDQDRRFYKFKTSGQELKVRIILRKTAPGGFGADVTVYGNAEDKVGSYFAGSEDAVSFSFDSNANSLYYIKVEGSSSGDRGPYELLVKPEQ